MGNCSSCKDEPEDPNYPNGKPFQHEPNWEGPVKKRSCTDVICLLLFLVLLGAWGFVAFLAFSEGDINKVRYILNFLMISTYVVCYQFSSTYKIV